MKTVLIERRIARSLRVRFALVAAIAGIAVVFSPVVAFAASYGSYTAPGYNYQVLDDFPWWTGAQGYSFSLTALDGNLYGTTQQSNGAPDANGDGHNGNGCIFYTSMTPGDSIHTLYQFTNGPSDGGQPTCTLLRVGGTLYGTCATGGLNYNSGDPAASNGTVFEITPGAGGPTGLGSIPSPSHNGSNGYPNCGLTLVGGNLYGVDTNGLFFSASTAANYNSLVHPYFVNSTYWNNASGGFLLGPDGKTMYGTNGVGVFSLNTNGVYTPLLTFGSGNDASTWGTTCSLVRSGTTLYGMTMVGGANASSDGDYGNIFSVGIDGSGYKSLYSFTGGTLNGAYPIGSLTISGSTLYGMTMGGTGWGGYMSDGAAPNQNGNIFSFNLSSSSFQNLYTFSNDGVTTDGGQPTGTLTLRGQTLYGETTMGSGAAGNGTIFALSGPAIQTIVNGTFAQTTNGTFNWSTATWSSGNWNDMPPGQNALDTAVFGTVPGVGGTTTVNMDSNTSLSSLSFSNGSSFLISGTNTLTMSNGAAAATITNNAGNHTIGVPIAMGSDLVVTTAVNSTLGLSGSISGGGNLTIQGAGSVTLNAANTYTGATTISGGTLILGGTESGAENLPTTTALNIAAGALDLAGNSQTVGSLSGSAGAIVTNSLSSSYLSTLTVAPSAGSTTFAGNITSNVALSLSGSGELTLSGTNAYTGGTTVSGGTLDIATPSALAGSGLVTIAAGGRLVLGSGAGIGALLAASSPAGSDAVALSGAAVPATLGGPQSGYENMATLGGAPASSQGGAGSAVGGAAAAVPEPGTLALLAAGAVVLAAFVRRKRR